MVEPLSTYHKMPLYWPVAWSVVILVGRLGLITPTET